MKFCPRCSAIISDPNEEVCHNCGYAFHTTAGEGEGAPQANSPQAAQPAPGAGATEAAPQQVMPAAQGPSLFDAGEAPPAPPAGPPTPAAAFGSMPEAPAAPAAETPLFGQQPPQASPPAPAVPASQPPAAPPAGGSYFDETPVQTLAMEAQPSPPSQQPAATGQPAAQGTAAPAPGAAMPGPPAQAQAPAPSFTPVSEAPAPPQSAPTPPEPPMYNASAAGQPASSTPAGPPAPPKRAESRQDLQELFAAIEAAERPSSPPSAPRQAPPAEAQQPRPEAQPPAAQPFAEAQQAPPAEAQAPGPEAFQPAPLQQDAPQPAATPAQPEQGPAPEAPAPEASAAQLPSYLQGYEPALSQPPPQVPNPEPTPPQQPEADVMAPPPAAFEPQPGPLQQPGFPEQQPDLTQQQPEPTQQPIPEQPPQQLFDQTQQEQPPGQSQAGAPADKEKRADKIAALFAEPKEHQGAQNQQTTAQFQPGQQPAAQARQSAAASPPEQDVQAMFAAAQQTGRTAAQQNGKPAPAPYPQDDWAGQGKGGKKRKGKKGKNTLGRIALTVLLVLLGTALMTTGLLWFNNRPASTINAFATALQEKDIEKLEELCFANGTNFSTEGWDALCATFADEAKLEALKTELSNQAAGKKDTRTYPAIEVKSEPFVLFIQKHTILINGVSLSIPDATAKTEVTMNGTPRAGTDQAVGGLMFTGLMPGHYTVVVSGGGAEAQNVEKDLFKYPDVNTLDDAEEAPDPDPASSAPASSAPASSAAATTETELNAVLVDFYQSYLECINNQSMEAIRNSTQSNTQAMAQRIINAENAGNLFEFVGATVDAATIQEGERDGVRTVTFDASFQFRYRSRSDGGDFQSGSNRQRVEMVLEDGKWLVNQMTRI